MADSSPLDGRAMASCLGGFLDICVDPPTTDVTLMSDLDTTNAPMCAAYTAKYNGGQGAAEDQACVIAGLSITIPGGKTVNVTGNRKLILYATTGAITIAGTLDASSRRTKSGGGPAADLGPCPTKGSGQNGFFGGGYGGSFAGPGNNGGSSPAGTGGVANPAFTPTTLQTSCAASDGQGGSGNRGRGGGAVLLLAKTTITISGTLNASGGGGEGGTGAGAGGGGGAGGMIVLEGSMVDIPGKCFANGGGGGGGSSSFNPARSGGESTAPDMQGKGGSHADRGGDGGDGGFADTGSLPGGSGSSAGMEVGGGGGGGGGVGIVKLVTPQAAMNTTDPKHVAPLPN